MNPVRASLRYQQVTLTLAAMLFLVGLYALFTMPRREDPKITIHTGIVSAIYPGASVEQVEDQVTRKIEEHLFRFEEVRRDKTFATTRNGVVVINVELIDTIKNTDEFWAKLRLDMAQMKQSELPSTVMGPVVDSDFGDTTAVLIAVHGGHYGYRELKEFAQRTETALRALPAVSKIKRIGDQKEEIDLSVSTGRLAQYAMTPQKIMQAFAGRNDVHFAGRLLAGDARTPLDSTSQLRSEDEIRRMMVDVTLAGQPVYIGDVADVTRVYKDPSQFARTNGEPTILLAVEMHEGNNIVSFGKQVHRTLGQLSATLPSGVQLELVADQPRVVSERILNFFHEFGIAIVAVILVTMLLLPLRVALVSSVAIPVTVSITFAMLDALGIELQQVSIAALIVVLGMVVDDAIVIADNYVELLDRKRPINQAAEHCATEMAVPVLTATLTIIASFAPMLLLSGAVGEFIRALPIAVAVALGTSYIVAMLLTPLIARFFIQKGLKDHEEEEALAHSKKKSPLDHMQEQYNRLITLAMHHKRQALWSGLTAFVAGVVVLQFVPQQFFPLAERDQFVMDVWMPEGTRIEATDATVKKIEAELRKESEVSSFTSLLGVSAPRFYYNVNPQPNASNYAQIVVNTKSVKKTPKLVAAMRERLSDLVPEARVFVKELQQGNVMEAPVEVRISGPDAKTLRALSDQVEEIFRHTRGATYLHTDWHEDAMQMGVEVRQEVANRMGLTNGAIAQQLAGSLEGAPLTTFWEGDRGVDVVLRVDPQERKSFDNIGDTYVISPATGARMPVSAVATLKPEWQPGRIVRRNGVRTITVRAFPDGHRLASQILGDVQKQIKKLPLPEGYQIAYGGEDENQRSTFAEMVHALIISLVLIFLILLFQFRTLLDALIVMMAFPLALPGAAFGLFLTHNTYGFTAFIGVISLGGLVVRNSIILIDYIHVRMKAGVPLEKAALEAGERRLRPIFLTTMAAAVGVVPMILSGSSLWSPLASVIAFGLLGSMFFTLVVIPVLFVAMHGERGQAALRKAGSWFSRSPVTPAVVVLALLLAGVAAQAQGEKTARRVTLDEAVKMASQHNSTVRLAELKAREMEAKVAQARANYFPQVDNQTDAVHLGTSHVLTIPMGSLGVYSGVGALPGKDVKIDLGERNFLLSQTTAAQPLTQVFKIHAGVSVAKADAGAAQADARRARNEVALNVKKLYLGLLSAERRRSAAELRIAAGEERLQEARNAADAGAVLELNVLEGKAQIADARHQLGSLVDTIGDLREQLNDLLGLPLATELELAEPKFVPADSPGEGLAEMALAHNPEVAAARQTVAKARSGVNVARAEFIPEVGAYAQYVYQNGVPFLHENNGIAGIRMNWTLSEFGKRSGLVKERSAQREQAEENLRQTENRVRLSADKEARKVRRAETGLVAARESVAARAEMRRIVADQVQAGTANASALKEAEAKLAEAHATLFDAEVGQATARAELARTLGEE